eukprot:503975-Pelagomonas_calceolata.AAC.1
MPLARKNCEGVIAALTGVLSCPPCTALLCFARNQVQARCYAPYTKELKIVWDPLSEWSV